MLCGVCSAENTKDLPFCSACGGPFDSGPEAATANTSTDRHRLARLGDRVTATILDVCFLIAILLLAAMASSTRIGAGIGNSLSRTAWATVALTAGTAYFWLCEAVFGATLGKALTGIQVRAEKGGRCGFLASLVRNLLRAVDGLGAYLFGFIVALTSKSRQRVGDLAAGTIVVEHTFPKIARAGLAMLWVEMFAAGLIGAFLLHRSASAAKDSTPAVRQDPPPSGPPGITAEFLSNGGAMPTPKTPYKPGETVRLKYDITGFAKGPDGRPSLLVNVLASDPKGLPLDHPWTDSFHAHLNPGMPVQGFFNVMLPAFAPPGTYQIRIWARDDLKKREFQVSASFPVAAAVAAAPRGLELRNFALSLAPDGAPLANPLVHAGGSVYLRAGIFGMRFRQDQVNARIALKIVSPGGKVVFNQPDYASINAEILYHPSSFWIPFSGDLKLPAKLKKGTYTGRLTLFDNIAHRTISTEAKFRVQ